MNTISQKCVSRKTIAGLLAALLLGWSGAAKAQSASGPAAGETVPLDAVMLELDLPPGAEVSINGAPKGTRRQFLFQPFRPADSGLYDVRVRLRDGREVSRSVLLQGGWSVRLPVVADPSSRPEIVIQSGHVGEITAVAYSPDGRHVVTGSKDNTAVIWDAETGQQIRTLLASNFVNSVAYSPNGRHILTGSAEAVIWDAQTGQKVGTLAGHKDVRSVAYSSDGRRIVTGSHDNTAVIWDAVTGEMLRTLVGHTELLTSVALSSDGRRAITGSWDKTAVIWDADTGQKLHTLTGHTDWVTTVAYSPDGRRVATGSEDNSVVIWDADTGQKKVTLPRKLIGVESVTYSPDGRQVVTGSYEVVIWDAETGKELRTLTDSMIRVNSVSYRSDGRRIISGGGDPLVDMEPPTAIIWDLETGRRIQTLTGHTHSVSSVCPSPDGRRIITGSEDKTAVIWDTESGKKIHSLTGHEFEVFSVAYSPDCRRVITGAWGDATIWDAETGQKLRSLVDEGHAATSVAYSPDGRHVVTGGLATKPKRHTVVIWDAESGEKTRPLTGHRDLVQSAAYSPDSRHIITGSKDKTAVIWDAETGEKLRTLSPGPGKGSEPVWVVGVDSVAYSRDGRRVITTGWRDGAALIWDAETGEKLQSLTGHAKTVKAVAYSPDGRRILTGSWDNTAVIWDAETGQKLHTLAGHTDGVKSVSYTPDGRRVLTGSTDGTTRLWDAATGDELARLITFDASRDWLVVTPEGLFDGSEGGRQKVSYRIGSGLNVVPVDRFFQDFSHPGLLAELYRGARPMPSVEFGKAKPPQLKIASPPSGAAVQPEVTVEVEATDQGSGISALSLYHNGARVLARGQATVNGKVTRRSFTVALIEGANRLTAKAASGDGSWEAEPAEVVLTYEKPLPKSELYLVAVGVSRYADAGLNLSFAAQDAHSFAELFQRRGKRLYERVHVTELLDGRSTRQAISQSLREVAAATRPQDTLVVFLAGHGVMVGQRFYFVPHELHRQATQLDDDVRQQGLPVDALTDALGSARALKRALILDTCASGGALGVVLKGRSGVGFRKAIEQQARTQGIFTIAAAAATQEAQESEKLRHGVLSYALLAGLKAVDGGPLEGQGVQPGGEGVVDVLEWFNFAAGRVPRLTESLYGSAQDVQLGAQGASFPLLPIADN